MCDDDVWRYTRRRADSRVSTRIVPRLALRALIPVALFNVFGLFVFGVFVPGLVLPTLRALVVPVRSGHAGELDLLLEDSAILVHHRVVGREEGDCDEEGAGVVGTGRRRGSALTGRTNRRAGPRRARGGTKRDETRATHVSRTPRARTRTAPPGPCPSARVSCPRRVARDLLPPPAPLRARSPSPSSRGARVRRHGCEARVDVMTGDRERLRAILRPRVALIAFLCAPRANEPSDSRPERSLVAPNPVWLRKRLCTTGLGAVVNRPRTHLRAARKMATVLGTSSFVGAAPRVGLKVRLASRPRRVSPRARRARANATPRLGVIISRRPHSRLPTRVAASDPPPPIARR